MFSQRAVILVPLPALSKIQLTIISPAKDGSARSNCVAHTIRCFGTSARKRPRNVSVRSEVLPRDEGGLRRIDEGHPDRATFARLERVDHAGHGTWREPGGDGGGIEEGAIHGFAWRID